MITRTVLVFFVCMVMHTPSFAGDNSGFKEIFDSIDGLSCAHVMQILNAQKKATKAADIVLDAQYTQRVIETYALLSRCALNKPTRAEFYDGLLKGMVAALGDPHSGYMNEGEFKEFKEQTDGQFFGIGATLERQPQEGRLRALKVVSASPNAPAEKAGLKSGDVILKINDRLVISYKDINNAVRDMKGPQGTAVSLLVVREGVAEPFIVAIIRDEIKTEFQKTMLLPNRWFFAKISSFEGKRATGSTRLSLCVDIQSAYKKALLRNPDLKGFILDLRDNPGGLLNGASCIVDLFAPESLRGKPLLSVETRDGLEAYPIAIAPEDMLKGKPLVVLVNEGSASASEIVAKAVQYYDLGVVVGSKTFGKGSIQIIMSLSDEKTAAKYTYAQYLVGPTSAPTPVQGVGVTPNILARKERGNKEFSKIPFGIRESDLSGSLSTSTAAKDIVVKRTKEVNPALYIAITRLLGDDPIHLEVVDEEAP